MTPMSEQPWTSWNYPMIEEDEQQQQQQQLSDDREEEDNNNNNGYRQEKHLSLTSNDLPNDEQDQQQQDYDHLSISSNSNRRNKKHHFNDWKLDTKEARKRSPSHLFSQMMGSQASTGQAAARRRQQQHEHHPQQPQQQIDPLIGVVPALDDSSFEVEPSVLPLLGFHSAAVQFNYNRPSEAIIKKILRQAGESVVYKFYLFNCIN